jgi:hypothetical protein
MATVPLQDTALAIEELSHARERLSLRAVDQLGPLDADRGGPGGVARARGSRLQFR